MNKMRSNSASFKKILNEIKAKFAFVDDIYYSEHIGNWTLKYGDGESEEFDTFEDVLTEIRLISAQ